MKGKVLSLSVLRGLLNSGGDNLRGRVGLPCALGGLGNAVCGLCCAVKWCAALKVKACDFPCWKGREGTIRQREVLILRCRILQSKTGKWRAVLWGVLRILIPVLKSGILKRVIAAIACQGFSEVGL